MSLSLNVLKKQIGMVDFNAETDFDDEIELACFFNDERLLDLMNEVGSKQDVFIVFNETEFSQLINIAQQIDGGTFQEEKEYKYRYANETMLDFYKRWDNIIKKLKMALYRLDWEEEHIVVYISC